MQYRGHQVPESIGADLQIYLSLSHLKFWFRHMFIVLSREYTYSHSSTVCTVVTELTSFPSLSLKSARANSFRLNPLNSTSSTKCVGFLNSTPFCVLPFSNFTSGKDFPTSAARTSRGSMTSAGGVICCFNVDPCETFVEFREVVEAFDLTPKSVDEFRGL